MNILYISGAKIKIGVLSVKIMSRLSIQKEAMSPASLMQEMAEIFVSG